MLFNAEEKIKYILFLWKEHKHRALLLLFLSIINTTMTVAYPVIIAKIIDGLNNLQNKTMLFHNIAILIAIVFVAVIAYSFLQINRSYINMSTFWSLNLKMTIFVLKMGRKFFEKFDHGELMTRLGDDIDKISWYVCSGIFRFIDAVSIISFSLIVMGGYSIKLTAMIFIPISVIIAILFATDNQFEKAFVKLQKNISNVNSNIEKTFSSIKVVKSNNMENFTDYEFSKILRKRKRSELKVALFESLWHSSDYFVNYTGLIIILWFGGKMVIDKTITLGVFVAFMNYLYLMLEHLYSFAYFFISTNRTFVSINRHLQVLKYANKINPLSNLSEENIFDNIDYQNNDGDINKLSTGNNKDKVNVKFDNIESIEFKNVSLEINGRTILNNINFRINRGEFIGITGKIGSGKTMAMEILIGLEKATSGKVLINGINFENIDLKNLREKFGFVFQDPILFSSSIYDNIVMKSTSNKIYNDYKKRGMLSNLYWKDNKNNKSGLSIDSKNDKNLEKSINISALKDDISAFTDGVNTLVGPKGIMVSGGQRERITIARAIYKNPEVYIFDDSTRSLDSETEKKVLNNIKNLKKDATIIMITQRLASLKEADKIILFDNGKIEAIGKHEELLSKSNLYKELYYISVKE